MIIGLDVGGTHTDVVLLARDCIVRRFKVATDPHNLLESVQKGLDEVTREVAPQDIRRIVLSTTLTTNAIVQGNLSDTGMIVSGGPGLDPRWFRTNTHYFQVSGAIDHRGREIEPVDNLEIKTLAAQLRAEGVKQLGVVGKFSVRNPKHELEIKRILENDFDHIVMGHRISGNLNFPRRVATAYLNAAVYPLYRKFFDAVRDSLRKKGLAIPIYILKADGGTMSLDASLETPGQTILSGPAASVMGSLPFASPEKETLVMDIGGTTTDMAILIRQVPLLDPVGIELGGYKTLIRALKTRSIPVGGDSVVRYAGGKLMVGPDRQGPAMAYGGPVPTPTDALVVLGKTQKGDFEASRRGLLPIAREMNTSLENLASQIFDLACRKIIEAAAQMVADINSKPVYTIHELLEGHQVKPEEILVSGGPAPFFGARLAALADFNVRIVPQWHVANAIGAALARNTCEVILFADTERGVVVAPAEEFKQSIPGDFDGKDALRLAEDLLRKKYFEQGADQNGIETEVLENMQFNMVRGFQTTGRNIRVRLQVKPGLIPEYREIAQSLFEQSPLPP